MYTSTTTDESLWLGVKCVFIANRGECALRIIRTCNKLKIKSVVTHTPQDDLGVHVSAATSSDTTSATQVSSYLEIDELVAAAISAKADSVHPGYGFLSESAEFAKACIEADLTWLGPSPETMLSFAVKTTAIEIARKHGVTMLESSPAMSNPDSAVEWAEKLGLPVIIKPVGGGGGIGMKVCKTIEEVRDQVSATAALAKSYFADARIFIEHFIENGRHIEVQVFGDGKGTVAVLGERECSLQRRFQKVIEETPSPCLNDDQRTKLFSTVKTLCEGIKYESAGTVEFVYDEGCGEFYFLEVNTRIQVEHGVTEMVSGFELDLVEWMIRQGRPETAVSLKNFEWKPVGASIQCRVYAENPVKDFSPVSGVIGEYFIPTDEPGSRFESSVFRGYTISSAYDPMIMKILQWAPERSEAIRRLQRTLSRTVVKGPPNNLTFLHDLISSDIFSSGSTYTNTIASFEFSRMYVDVLKTGPGVTVQDFPGRVQQGLWRVGVPPSGPMDHLSLRLANSLVGNSESAAGLEIDLQGGPTLKFHCSTKVALVGAGFKMELNGILAPSNHVLVIHPNSVLAISSVTSNQGIRCYLAVLGGLDVPMYLGSRSTFVNGGFGGHQGRSLCAGDTMTIGKQPAKFPTTLALPTQLWPHHTNNWKIRVLPGPMAAPDYMTEEDMIMLYSTEWKVHHNSSRLGIRLIGPSPTWARSDGGEGGSHPSNIHDCEYAVGTINFTGNMPVIIGHDGPSLGGFVCPCTIIHADLWMIGQVQAGDTIRFCKVNLLQAISLRVCQNAAISTRTPVSIDTDMVKKHPSVIKSNNIDGTAILLSIPPNPTKEHPGMCIRLAGDSNILVEYGSMILDIRLRIRIHFLEKKILSETIIGLQETAPGVRSLQIRYDPLTLPLLDLIQIVKSIDMILPSLQDVVIPSRIIRLPIAWNSNGVRDSLAQYQKSGRSEAPYLPSNIDFVGKNNGIGSQDVFDKVMRASYMCLGLGDVYLGACCAVPIDPRDRLVVPKFNPARTYTQEGTVGLGGAYMCIYPMDSPGGYQLMGRTLPIWNTWGTNSSAGIFNEEKPWMLNMFDQIQFYPVEEDKLNTLRSQFKAGKFTPEIRNESFSIAKYSKLLESIDSEVQVQRALQEKASVEQNKLEILSLEKLKFLDDMGSVATAISDIPDNCEVVTAQITSLVTKVCVIEGSKVTKGETIAILEAMKANFHVHATESGVLTKMMVIEGMMIELGGSIAMIELVKENIATQSDGAANTEQSANQHSMQIESLREAYKSGIVSPSDIVEQIFSQIHANGGSKKGNVWIELGDKRKIMDYARALETKTADYDVMPLYGIPFSVKDNIDVEGWHTTAACPNYKHLPAVSSTVVGKLLSAGAIVIGKTNMDQFATGLNGTRSPYGACENSLNPKYISGGSSSGSAVALAKGYCSFSLGTDTAGSGRVPAQFNNIVGLKPSKGRISCSGIVPACKSLDCCSIFALSAIDAQIVLQVAEGNDPTDQFSRGDVVEELSSLSSFRFGVPQPHQLVFFDDKNSATMFEDACAHLECIGGTRVTVDYSPFNETANLLYEGPWVAERLLAIKCFFENTPECLLETTRAIIGNGNKYSAVDTFRAVHQLEALRKKSSITWKSIDVLVTPTAGTTYTIAQMKADPIQLNTNLGYYTNFMNLLDMTAIALPSGFAYDNGLPYGITISAPAPTDTMLLDLGKRFQIHTKLSLGATNEKLFAKPTTISAPFEDDMMEVLVCGAHLSGLPLNWQLLARSAVLKLKTVTAPNYRLYALPGGLRPALVECGSEDSKASPIEVEVWNVPIIHVGSFLRGIPHPLGLGKVELENGDKVTGFVCSQNGLTDAIEVTKYGSWRAFKANNIR